VAVRQRETLSGVSWSARTSLCHKQKQVECSRLVVQRCHLVNVIELVLPSAYLSPQPKRQIDRFSHFCTAHLWNVPILYSGQPFPPKLPLLMGIWTPSNSWFLGPIRAHNPNIISFGSAVLQGSLVYRLTDHTTRSVTIDRIYIMYSGRCGLIMNFSMLSFSMLCFIASGKYFKSYCPVWNIIIVYDNARCAVILLVMVALWNRADHYIFMLWFVLLLLLLSFFFLA